MHAYLKLMRNKTFGKYIDWANYQTYASQWCLGGVDDCYQAVSTLEQAIGAHKLVLAANSGHDELSKGAVRHWGLPPDKFLHVAQQYANSALIRGVAVWSLELSEVGLLNASRKCSSSLIASRRSISSTRSTAWSTMALAFCILTKLPKQHVLAGEALI